MGWLQKYGMWIILGLIIVLFIVWMVFRNKKMKKQEQEIIDRNNAIKPGNKVKTIGGICGIVVEVDKEENTFVLETGSVTSGKSYIKFDKLAIYQTDAVPEKAEGGDYESPTAESSLSAPEGSDATDAKND